MVFYLLMIISFDLDDTLVSSDPDFSLMKGNILTSLLRKECLREGTVYLFKILKREDHKIYIYTTSLRSIFYIRILFLSYGTWPNKIINKNIHDRVLGKDRNMASKLPNRFNIDLHIDDSEGVRMEGIKFGYRTLIIQPLDKDWANKILATLV